ncbi:hypothetical protein [Crossiella cryophila]|uniref:DNRLRE domain-containing protein n=1 Tax=Crossiella cryophila TaxID=43355 RepID=A0A7W7CHW6_9PSEU|nr:hypothetical protein [Crossiella cryophila]MBB4681524.1 hypothetical protein [Crossiella cryophila]
MSVALAGTGVVAVAPVALGEAAASALARERGERVEATALRAGADRVFANPDGTFTAEQLTTVRPDRWAVVSSRTPKQPDHNRDGPVTIGLDGERWEVTRSFFGFDLSRLRGKQILESRLYLDQTGTGSCRPSAIELWHTGPVDQDTSWERQPEWLSKVDSKEASWGAPGCPARPLALEAGVAVTAAAESGRLTLGLRAEREWNRGAWKSFGNAPRLTTDYNSVPGKPVRQRVDIMDCPEPPGELILFTPAPRLRADMVDADGDWVDAEFEWWANGSKVGGVTATNIPDGFPADICLPRGVFAHESVFSWRVRAKDRLATGPWSEWCAVRVDSQNPHSAPAVSSAEYPEGKWQPWPPKTGTFVFSPNGVTDVVEYSWQALTGEGGRVPAGPDGTASIVYTPTMARPLWLEVYSQDAAGNRSPLKRYEFGVRPG